MKPAKFPEVRPWPFQSEPRAARPTGFALVLVMAMLVLAAGLVTAFFSRALQEQRTGDASGGGVQATLLASSATEMLLADFFAEMEAGSTFDDQHGIRMLRPRLVALDPSGHTLAAPSMTPQRSTLLDNLPNVVKISRAGLPFHEDLPGYVGGDGPARAAMVSTEEPSLNSRVVAAHRWNEPRLMTPGEFATFPSPDWIYLERSGDTVDPDQAMLSALADPNPANQNFVIGRFAYVVYDVGGLLDINVVGNALAEEHNRHRGRLHQVDLADGIPEVEPEAFAQFVGNWRWPDLADDETELFQPDRDFLEVDHGQQALVNRRDLLAHATTGRPGIPEATLPFLTVYSRAFDTPHWRPDPDYWTEAFWSDAVSEVPPESFNPDLVTVRFNQETVLERGADPAVTVPPGTPVMPRRFPLGKLGLFDQASPDPDSLRYYFGLAPADEVDTYRYVEAVFSPQGPRLARLEEVADMGREPNFFEILRAVILAGSLGKTAGHSMTIDVGRDQSGDLQVLQIGANIMDQWDADDIPTTLRFPTGGDNPWEDPLEVYGTENLPYIQQFNVVQHRPAHDRDRLQMWAVFEVWNPHQNATSAPEVGDFRIVPLDGSFAIGYVYYGVRDYDPRTRGGVSWIWEDFRFVERDVDLLEVNQGMSMTFPSEGDYSELTLVGGTQAPETEGDVPGVLLWDFDVGFTETGDFNPLFNPGVPVKGVRSGPAQISLNNMFDYDDPEEGKIGLSPYEATQDYDDSNPYGERWYPEGTTFPNMDPAFWVHTQRTRPATDGGEETFEAVYARYAIKDFNASRTIRPSFSSHHFTMEDLLDPQWFPEGVPPTFALQVDTGNGWKTYQRVDHWFRRNIHQTMHYDGRRYARPGTGDYARSEITHHSQLDAAGLDAIMEDEDRRTFYHWRPIQSYVRFDPRGHRFGFNESRRWDFHNPLRQTAGPATPGGWLAMSPGYGGAAAAHRGFEIWPEGTWSDWRGAGLMTNSPDPETPDAWHPTRYSDRDGVIRPADAYFGNSTEVVPLLAGRYEDRPVILNRPFRSAGDLGHVFRDLPWKSLDFSSRWSGDLGLLDVFTLEEPSSDLPLVAGKVNLNTRRPEVLQTLLAGTLERFGDFHDAVPELIISEERAVAIAAQIVDESHENPFSTPGDLIPRAFHPEGESGPLDAVVRKPEREAAIRSLAALGQTRTWNLMFDMVAQSGRFTAASQDGSDFLVTGKKRLWVHVAIDRITGRLLHMTSEPIPNE